MRAWADPDELSNCDDNEVCALLSDGVIGVCTNEVDPNRPAPLEPCQLLGGWCGPETLCIQVDQQGNGSCIEVCRLNLGNEDCTGNTTCDRNIIDSPLLGLCVP